MGMQCCWEGYEMSKRRKRRAVVAVIASFGKKEGEMPTHNVCSALCVKRWRRYGPPSHTPQKGQGKDSFTSPWETDKH